jgi:hypothetical protein
MSYSGMQYCADWTVCSLLRLPLPAVGAGDANAMTAATRVVVIFVDMVFHPGVEAHRFCGLDRERRRFIPRLASMKVFVSWYDLNHRDIAVGLPSWLHGVVGESDHYDTAVMAAIANARAIVILINIVMLLVGKPEAASAD